MPSYPAPGDPEPKEFQEFDAFFANGPELAKRLGDVIDDIGADGDNSVYKSVFWDDPANAELKKSRAHYRDDWLEEKNKSFWGSTNASDFEKDLCIELRKAALLAHEQTPMKPLKMKWEAAVGRTALAVDHEERADAVVIIVNTPMPKHQMASQ